MFGAVDLTGILLALLPLYSKQMDGFVIAVNLWDFKPANGWICIICWILIAAIRSTWNRKISIESYVHRQWEKSYYYQFFIDQHNSSLIFCNDKRDLLRCDSLSLVDDKGWVTFLCYCKMQYEGASGCLI